MAIRVRILTSFLVLAGSTLAITGESAAEPPAETSTTPAPIVLAVSGPRRGDVELPALEKAIGKELGAPVVPASDQPIPPGAARLELVLTEDRLLVRHTAPDGRVLERTVDRPADDAALIEAVAWLAGNLGRNEAGELIDELTATEPPPDAAPEADPEPEPDPDAEPEPEPKVATPAPAAPPPSTTTSLEDVNETPGPTSFVGTPIQLTLAHPIALFPDADHRRFFFETGLFYSRLGALRGAGINAVAHRIDHELEGLQFAGVWSHQNGKMRGLRFAGAVTTGAATEVEGATFAGLVDLQAGQGKFSGQRFAGLVTAHAGPNQGAMIGGLGNVLGSADGFLFGGAFNFVGHEEKDLFRGLALAGAVNGTRHAQGAQLAGAGNVAGDVDGVQVSGGFNGARRLRGVQIGLLNVASRVEGTQIGLVNVAREVEGAALAPINLVEKSRIQALAFSSTAAPLSTGIRFVVAPLVTTTSIGYDPLGETDRLVPQIALGGRIPFEPLYADIEAGYAPEIVPESHPTEETVQTVRFRGSVGWDVLPPLGIFAAGGVRYAIDPKEVGPEFLGGITVL